MSNSLTVKNTSERFYELDLFRFIAALSVVLFHYTFDGPRQGGNPIQYPELGNVTKYGYLGVQLFFIISGFVIALSAEGRSTRQFITSRITRLYPAFWIACTLTFIITFFVTSKLQTPNLIQYGINMTMLHDFFSTRSIDGVYWTLTYELKFYFIIALLLIFNQFKRIELLIILWLAYSAMYLTGFKIKYIGVLLFPDYGVFFIAGMIFYLIKKSEHKNIRHVFYLLITYILAICISHKQGINNDLITGITHSSIIIFTAVTVFFSVFTLIAFGRLKIFKAEWASLLGSLTYPLYLTHANIGYVAFYQLEKYINKYILLLIIIFLSLLIAYLIVKYIEKPLSRFLRELFTPYIQKKDNTFYQP